MEDQQMSALRGKIREVFGSEDSFAKAFGITRQGLQLKLSGKVGWTLSGIRKAVGLLGIGDNPDEIYRMFFKKEGK